jgi:hypothetical protein
LIWVLSNETGQVRGRAGFPDRKGIVHLGHAGGQDWVSTDLGAVGAFVLAETRS